MYRILLGIFCCAAASAIDFDFTSPQPVARGGVPLVEVDDAFQIGGTPERRSLWFDGTVKARTIHDSGKMNAAGGLTIAAEVEFAAKGGKELHILLLKPREWLLGRDGKNLYFNMNCGGKWQKGVNIPMDFSRPIRLVLLYAPDGRLTVRGNGKILKSVKLNWPAPDGGAENLQLGGGWGEVWNLRGGISRLAVSPAVWETSRIEGFEK